MYNSDKTLTKYRAYLQAEGLAGSSVSCYTSMVKTFLEGKRKSPERISREEIIAYLAGIASPVTRKQARAGILKFYLMLEHRKKVKNIPNPKQPKSLPAFLTEEQTARMMRAIVNHKHQALIHTLYIGGLRISELLNLKLDDVKGSAAKLRINASKGNKDRLVPVPFPTIKLLRDYYKEYHPATYLFEGARGKRYSASSVKNIMKRALAVAGISGKYTPHSLRHSRATHLVNEGIDISVVKDFLGHNSIKTTQIYLHCASSTMDNRLRDISPIPATLF